MKQLFQPHVIANKFLCLALSAPFFSTLLTGDVRPLPGLTPQPDVSFQQSTQNTDNPVEQLDFGKERCRTLALNHTDNYKFEVRDQGGPQFIHVEVAQKGIDITLVLSGPGNFSVSRDWPNGRYGIETLSHALTPGEYTLKVQGTDAEKVEGAEYCLRAQSEPSPSPRGIKRAEAEEAYAKGLSLIAKARSAADMVTAVKEVKAASDLWRNVDEYGYATALTTYAYYGAFYTNLLPREDALRTFNETLILWRRIGDIRRMAVAIHGIGKVYDVHNQINEASDQYVEALRLWRLPETPKVPLEEASTLNNLATIRQQQGYYSDALELFDLAIKKLEEGHNPREKAISLNNMGRLYLDLEDYPMAEECFKAAQEIRGKADFHPLGWATTLQNWGLARAYQGDFARAKTMLAEGFKIRTKRGEARAYETRYSEGFVSSMQGDFDGALVIFETEILPQMEQKPVQKAVTLRSIGSLYRAKGDRLKALQMFREALAATSSVTEPGVVSFVLFDLGRVEMELNLLEDAAEHLKQAINLIEERRTRVISPEWRATYSASTRDVYEAYVEVLIRMKKPDEALEYSERGRARTLVDLLLETKVNIFQEPENFQRMKEYRAVQSELEAQQARLQGLEFQGSEVGKADLKNRINLLSSKLHVIDAAARANSRSYRALQTRRLKVSDIQKLIEDDSVLLEFLLGHNNSYLWVVPKVGNPVVIPLRPRAEIEDAALKVYGLLTARDKGNPIRTITNRTSLNLPRDVAAADKEYPVAAAALSNMILGEATNLIAGKRLLIVPDGALALIPFAALPVPSSTGKLPLDSNWKPLLLEHVIATLPSATALAVQREVFGGRSAATKTLGVVADPVFDSNDEPHRCESRLQQKRGKKWAGTFDNSRSRTEMLTRALGRSSFAEVVKLPRLPFSQQEMNAILETVPRRARFGACGFDANYAMATKRLSDFRLLHFATHGIVNTEHPELSGIVLSLVDPKGHYTPEGFLRLTDIYDLQLKADLVVLSSCYTALGRDIKGEGPISLTRGFMHAGARSVVASLWQVKDKSTVELMKYFYQGIMGSEHLPPATALQRAQIRLRRDHPDWPPFFWAAFTAQGEYA